jgi:hypothetical protein
MEKMGNFEQNLDTNKKTNKKNIQQPFALELNDRSLGIQNYQTG